MSAGEPRRGEVSKEADVPGEEEADDKVAGRAKRSERKAKDHSGMSRCNQGSQRGQPLHSIDNTVEGGTNPLCYQSRFSKGLV